MTSPEAQALRIIDANLNRVGEGLRLLEELARLQLNDATMSQQLKTMRHRLLRNDWSFTQQLLQARDAGSDVGIDMEVPGEEKNRELPAMLVANARRVQESLRTLEELSKIPGGIFDPEKFMVKITPLHCTNSCLENDIKTTGGYEYFTPYKPAEEALKAAGFDVLVFVPSYDEDGGLITCGNAILSGSLPNVDYEIIRG